MKKILALLREALQGEERHYTSGSIDRAIVLLSIPMVLEMVGESLFAVVDAYFVSGIGADAVATIGFTESVMTLIYSIAIGLSTAATAMVSRRVGEEKPEEASIAAVQVIFIGLAVSVVLGVLGWTYAADVLRLMGGSERLVSSGSGFTRIMFGSNLVIMMLFLLNGVFRGAGDASIAMRSLWIANILNIVLDPCLIFGWGPFPQMGLEGAALATAIGRGTGVLYQVYELVRGRGVIKIKPRHWRLRPDLIRQLLKVASGGIFQFIIASASWIFLMRIVAKFGSNIVAGYVIAIRLLIFTLLPSWGMANAAATLVGQNLGAGKPERAERSVWRTAFFNMIFLAVVSVSYWLLAPQLIGLFSQDQEVMQAGVVSMRIISLGYIFFAYGMVVGQAYNGAGDTFTPTLLNFVCFWLIEIPLAYLLATQMGLGHEGVYWSVAFSESLLAVLFIYFFQKGDWKKVEI
jgi:putative MATE family efflux protein